MNEREQAYYMMKGALEVLSKQEKELLNQAIQEIESVVKKHEDFGRTALIYLGVKLAAETPDEE